MLVGLGFDEVHRRIVLLLHRWYLLPALTWGKFDPKAAIEYNIYAPFEETSARKSFAVCDLERIIADILAIEPTVQCHCVSTLECSWRYVAAFIT